MKQENLVCPICEKGTLKKGKIKECIFGVFLGEFPAEICNKCKESFTDAETTRKIEQAATKKGVLGAGKKTKSFWDSKPYDRKDEKLSMKTDKVLYA